MRSKRQCTFPPPTRAFTFRYSKLSAVSQSQQDEGSRSPESSNAGPDGHDHGTERSAEPEPCELTGVTPTIIHGQSPLGNLDLVLTPQGLVDSTASQSVHLTQYCSPYHASFPSPFPVRHPAPHSADGQSPPGSRSRLYDRDASARFTTEEGELLQFYVEKLGPWLDVTSPERHFTYTVTSLALRCSLLLYAILAWSARLIRLLDKDRHRPDLEEDEGKFYQQCLQRLIPILDVESTEVHDDAVLATIGILRMSEQYDEYDTDQQFHLVPGAFSHADTLESASTLLGGLREATFFSYVRADIRMAILGRRGTRLQLDLWPFDNGCPSSDADWTHRMTWLLVHAINLLYAPTSPGLFTHEKLARLVDEWQVGKPTTFKPYFYDWPDREAFPTVKLLCPWHIVGLQFYHAAKILLAIAGPGSSQLHDLVGYSKLVEGEILLHSRMLCAISFSNDHFGCRINASHLVAMGAQFFTGRQEQWRAVDYFNVLQTTMAWPSEVCQDMLRKAYSSRAETTSYTF
ncbi:hypothetical protein LTR96_006324 [Exophiala xenobiotica]|nr:hypothetical protein LTR41_009226 [Exophiala xenobiotica]KAK5268617.1 hypothetical protein LTR96_006324 [Exophiala xenobiotica]KAK5336811.1 hypothetical protein LTR98_007117 [Exophiala xenobiotica]